MKKRTIDKILRYHFNRGEVRAMLKKGIVNGCGGKGGLNFDKVLQDNIVRFKSFNSDKVYKLFSDIKEVCYEHDYDFYLGGGLFSFVRANFRFARCIFKLTHWTNFKNRIVIFLICFILLNRHGKKYFSWKKEKFSITKTIKGMSKTILHSVRPIDIIILITMFFLAVIGLMKNGQAEEIQKISQNTQDIHDLFFDKDTEILQVEIK